MILITQKMLSSYKKKDVIKDILDKCKDSYCASCSSHRAHVESIAKRLMYYKIYGDLLKKGKKQLFILDVGGGYSTMSEILADNHKYTILDDTKKELYPQKRSVVYVCDEWQVHIQSLNSIHGNRIYGINWDVVIANDLFPNVDQRLDLFLEKFLPYCKEMRLSLTYFYDNPKWYFTKRLNGDETLCLCSWTKEQLSKILEKYKKYIQNANLSLLFRKNKSIFRNGRQVCVLKLKGGKG